MKKYLRRLVAVGLGLGISLAGASIAFAQDLTYDADTTVALTAPDIDLTIIAGSEADSLVVNDDSIVVTLPADTTFTLTSASRHMSISGQTNQATITTSCSGSRVETIVIASGSSVENITLTPTSTACFSGGGGGGGGGSAPSGPSTTTGSVTATPSAGGTTTYTPSDTGTPSVQVSVPPGAVGSNTTVNVSTTTLANAGITVGISTAGATALVGMPFTLSASSNGTAVTNFNSAVTVTFSYNESQLPPGTNESNLTVLFYNSATAQWETLPVVVDTVNNTITVNLTHFSVYALAVKPGVASPPTGGAHSAGSVIKTSDGTVWFITGDNMRRAFTSAGAFLSYGFLSWSQVVIANTGDLALPQGAFIAPRDGSLFCATAAKGTDVKGECALITGGQKASFTSEAVFKGLGFSFSRAQYGDSSFLSKTSNIASSTEAHRPGVLVNNSGTIQLVGQSSLMGIPSMAVFTSWGYSLSDVVAANTADKTIAQQGVMTSRVAGQLNP